MTATTPPVPVATPVAAQVQLALAGAHAAPAFAFAGDRIELRGVVRPFLAGQSVVVSVRAAGRLRQERVAIVRSADGEGGFELRLPTARTGTLAVSVSHAATSTMAAFSATGPRLRVLSANMSLGARGQGVWFIQRRLSRLHFAVPESGVYEAGTENAVIAYRKVLGLARISSTGAGVISDLERGAGLFRVRFPRDGKHVEANLAKQVLAEIEPHGRVYEIYTTSSGKPSTPTVLGRFQVYRKTPGANSEDMVDSNYFIRGYAIHGYPEVPTWAASHGCLRVPIEDAPAIFGWVQVGTIVDIYY
jgi:peptidoglycan hydrolase-like protein with peptidoglycan-binding domain